MQKLLKFVFTLESTSRQKMVRVMPSLILMTLFLLLFVQLSSQEPKEHVKNEFLDFLQNF